MLQKNQKPVLPLIQKLMGHQLDLQGQQKQPSHNLMDTSVTSPPATSLDAKPQVPLAHVGAQSNKQWLVENREMVEPRGIEPLTSTMPPAHVSAQSYKQWLVGYCKMVV